MIFDHLDSAHLYHTLHPHFKKAFDFLKQYEHGCDLPPQKIELDGKNLIAIIESVTSKQEQHCYLEAHSKYIDIQYTIKGIEQIGWSPLRECRQIKQSYDLEKDIAFFFDRPKTWLSMGNSQFAIFFPTDAHAPLLGEEAEIQKIIIKIAMA
ncbi:MAG: tabA [Chlamydiales bacterium]|jgi:YhcH/YjgK/YiaL family protein|nr:tabA [Chlamydiales bacterium]